jgi:PAS domain S-box-containing protein
VADRGTFEVNGWDGLLEALPRGVLQIAEDGRVVGANQAAARTLALPLETLVTSRLGVAPLVFASEAGGHLGHEEILCLAVRGDAEDLHRIPLRYRDADGTLRWIEFSAAVLPGGGAVVSLGDVTDRVRQDEALRASEARLRAIFDAEPECVKLVSRDGILLDMNPAGLAMLEVDRVEDAIGKPLIAMVVQEYREGFAALARKVFAGESVVGEFEIIGRKGTRRWMETHAGPLRDEAGQISCLLAVTRDVTARKRVQDALRESEEKLRGLYELSPLGIALTDMDGRYVEFNEAFRRICGYPSDELLRLDYWKLTPREYEKQEQKQLESLAETGHYGPYEKEYVQKNGRKIPIRLNGMLVSDRAGHRHIWSIVEDISAQRHFEEERRFVEFQLQRSQRLESLASLAGGVAHDMNNVLAAIESLAAVERDESPSGSALRESLDTIIRASERGSTLVRGLQGFARAGLAQEKKVDLNAIVRDETAILERTTLGKVRVNAELAEGLRPVLGDGAALSHALMNLCMNAVEAMPDGGRLVIRTENDGPAHVLLEVADDGRGMPKEVQERAWDPFFTTKPPGKGTGLGLAIVYGAVKAHGGEVELRSEPGEGTTVSIRLPVYQPSAGADSHSRRSPSGTRMLRVLVVDDDELVQKSTGRVLHAFGHEATIASNGEEALQLLENGHEFDAVVLDLNMPGIGGEATLAALRSRWSDVPVLLATGRADQVAIDLARTTSRVTLLTKPFAPPALNEQLVALVERWPRERR